MRRRDFINFTPAAPGFSAAQDCSKTRLTSVELSARCVGPVQRRSASSPAVAPTLVCTENLNPDVMVMEPAKDGVGIDDAGPLNRARDRRIFIQ